MRPSSISALKYDCKAFWWTHFGIFIDALHQLVRGQNQYVTIDTVVLEVGTYDGIHNKTEQCQSQNYILNTCMYRNINYRITERLKNETTWCIWTLHMSCGKKLMMVSYIVTQIGESLCTLTDTSWQASHVQIEYSKRWAIKKRIDKYFTVVFYMELST